MSALEVIEHSVYKRGQNVITAIARSIVQPLDTQETAAYCQALLYAGRHCAGTREAFARYDSRIGDG